jgi:hypothetical protein
VYTVGLWSVYTETHTEDSMDTTTDDRIPTALASGDSLKHYAGKLTTRRTWMGVQLLVRDQEHRDAVLGLLFWEGDDAWLLCTNCRDEITLYEGGICDGCRTEMTWADSQHDDTPALGEPWWAAR